MRYPLMASVALFLACASVAVAQSASPAGTTPSTRSASAAASSDGLELLTRVAQRYADAKSYIIVSVEERTDTSELRHYWNKTLLTASQAPGGRYYYKGVTETGGAIKASDGKTVWKYRPDEHRYTAESLSSPNPGGSGVIALQEMGVQYAENLRGTLARIAKSFNSAKRLPDATLTVDGRQVLCQVVEVQSADSKRLQPNYVFDKTIWIDAEHGTVVKIVEHAHTFMFSTHMPMEAETVTTYPTTVLDGAVDDSLFIFSPPTDARLIPEFPDPMDNMGSSKVGDPVPALKLKSADGQIVEVASFKGKPVLLDFWATWCAPCVASLPELAQIYKEGKDKGLVLLGVDRDEEATTAASLLAKKGYTWPDFHDGDGEIEKLMGSTGVPRVVLVDGQGTIVFDGTGMDGDKLRTHLVKLGPEYASLAPKPKPAACAASR